MVVYYLKSLRDLIKPSGHLFLTWFLEHPSNPAQPDLALARTSETRTGISGSHSSHPPLLRSWRPERAFWSNVFLMAIGASGRPIPLRVNTIRTS
jgi:hypothetical protein